MLMFPIFWLQGNIERPECEYKRKKRLYHPNHIPFTFHSRLEPPWSMRFHLCVASTFIAGCVACLMSNSFPYERRNTIPQMKEWNRRLRLEKHFFSSITRMVFSSSYAHNHLHLCGNLQQYIPGKLYIDSIISRVFFLRYKVDFSIWFYQPIYSFIYTLCTTWVTYHATCVQKLGMKTFNLTFYSQFGSRFSSSLVKKEKLLLDQQTRRARHDFYCCSFYCFCAFYFVRWTWESKGGGYKQSKNHSRKSLLVLLCKSYIQAELLGFFPDNTRKLSGV